VSTATFRASISAALLCITLGAQQASFSQERKTPAQLFKKISASVLIVEGYIWDDGSEEYQWELLGSAVALRPNLLVTNWHVIEAGRRSKSLRFRVAQGKKLWFVEVVIFNPSASGKDLCLLQIGGRLGKEAPIPLTRIRPSSTLKVGEPAYAIGAPFGMELTMSDGVISGLRIFNPFLAALKNDDRKEMIQTTAAVSPGSSGGGLFDASGRLIGIITSTIKNGQNMNFALPGEYILDLLSIYEKRNPNQ